MIPLITIALLAFTAAAVIIMRIARPGFGYGWLAAAIGALLAWISTFLWQVSLPQTLTLLQWLPLRPQPDFPGAGHHLDLCRPFYDHGPPRLGQHLGADGLGTHRRLVG